MNYCHNFNSIIRSRKCWEEEVSLGSDIFFSHAERVKLYALNTEDTGPYITDLGLSYSLWRSVVRSHRTDSVVTEAPGSVGAKGHVLEKTSLQNAQKPSDHHQNLTSFSLGHGETLHKICQNVFQKF